MPAPALARLFADLRRSRFSDLHGARVSAFVPVPERLLNDFLAAAMPASAPVRDVSVHPAAGNRFVVRARIARASFVPPLSLTAEIVRQPDPPDGPLVLRISALPGLVALAGAAASLAAVLPAGVRLEGQHLLVDIRVLLERAGYGEVLSFLDTLRITTEDGTVLVEVAAKA
jgi:hypothetical protein